MKRVRFLIFLAAGALFSAADLVAAQRTFVSAANGNDANACSRSLPCRSFAAAVLVTDPDGEVIVLDSGGYGVVTITQPASLIAPDGVHAGISASFGAAVTVDAGDSANVVLRNLSLNSQGATWGVHTMTVAALYVEKCNVSGFTTYGIAFYPYTAGSRLYVSDTVVRRSGNFGIYVSGDLASGPGVRATIDSVLLFQDGIGAYVDHAEATIFNSVASGNVSVGFNARTASKVTIEDSVAIDNGIGFFASFADAMIVTRCAATSSSNSGIMTFNNISTIYVTDTTITSNAVGISTVGGAVKTRGNNSLQANTMNGSFTGIYSPN